MELNLLKEMLVIIQGRYQILKKKYTHEGLVGLVLEVCVPKGVELGTHLLQFFLSWANLRNSNRTLSRSLIEDKRLVCTLNPASIALEDNLAFSGLTSHSLKSCNLMLGLMMVQKDTYNLPLFELPCHRGGSHPESDFHWTHGKLCRRSKTVNKTRKCDILERVV
jgi:hypothetical protein